jgi:hypothetical protein
MVHEPHELTQIGFASQIKNVVQWRMMVPIFTDLDEKNASAKMIHDFLKSMNVPPLDRKILLSPRRDNPKWQRGSCDFLHLRDPLPLLLCEVNVTPEVGWLDWHFEPITQELLEPVNEMPGSGVAPVDQRVIAVNFLGSRIVVFNWRNKRIILPEGSARSPNVSEEAIGVAAMQIPDCGG